MEFNCVICVRFILGIGFFDVVLVFKILCNNNFRICGK